jgi:hypothetical protein
MDFRLLTGSPSAVVTCASHLLAANPDWQPGSFAAAAGPDGRLRVALAMILRVGWPGRISELRILSCAEGNAHAAISRQLASGAWRLHALCVCVPTPPPTSQARKDRSPATPVRRPRIAALMCLPNP